MAIMIIKLKSYLVRLRDEERFKPEAERRKVPTITGLASDVGVSRVQMQRIVSGNVESIKLAVAAKVIAVIRERGFNMGITDLLEYRD